MKNFTKQNFKTNPLWIRLLIMTFMLVAGSSSAWAWTVYFDNSQTKWSNVYVVLGHDTYHRGDYKMTKVSNSDEIYYLTRDDWGDAKYITFSNSEIASGGANKGFKTAITSGYDSFSNGASSLNHLFYSKSNNTLSKGGDLYPRLVINCGLIGFYVGEYQDWNQSQFYVHSNGSGHISSYNTFDDGTTAKYGIIYAESKNYNVTHSTSWGGPTMGEKAILGKRYLITGDNSVSTAAGTTLSCTFNIDKTIKAGETSTASVTSSGKSKYGTKNYAVDSYYIKKSGESTLTKLTISGNELQTQSLEVGTYTIYVLLYDGKIYAKGAEQTLTVETACDPKSPTFVHTNSSYNEINTPTYYLGDKAFFKSTINCCLTADWSKTGTGTYTGLYGSTPNFYLTLSGLGEFTLKNNANDGCGGTTTPSIDFTVNPLTAPTFNIETEPNDQGATHALTYTTKNSGVWKAHLSWTPMSDSYKNVMVVRYSNNSNPTNGPVNGTTYEVGNIIDGGEVVYIGGDADNCDDPGTLEENKIYNYYIYTVNNNYYSTGTKHTLYTRFYVGGQPELCGEEWNTTADPMTFVGNGIWSLTFIEKDAREYQFKITDGSDWTTGWNTTNHKKPTGNYLECSEVTTSEGWKNISFTTPTKGNITIYYDENDGRAYVGFEPICLEKGNITLTTKANKTTDYSWGETAILSIDKNIIAPEFGNAYTATSYQWQKKNGNTYTNIDGATNETFNATDLAVGEHTYRVVVTYSYTDFGKNCTNTKESEPTTINVICPSPEVPKFEVTQHEVVCGNTNIQKGIIKITNPVAGYKYRLGNEGNTEYTLDANNSIQGIDGGAKYRISAVRYCGTAKSSTTNEEEYAEISKTDVKLTPTLTSTPIVKCGEGDNAYTPGTLVITNYNANYNYTITPNVGESTIEGSSATYSINAKAATEYTVTATHKTYNSCSTPATITVALTDNTPEATVSIADVAPICAGGSATLTCNVTPTKGTVNSYTWTLLGGSTQVTNTNTLSTGVIAEAGTYNYSVVVTLENAGCTKDFTSEIKPVTVKETPTAPNFGGNNSQTVCQNTDVTLPTEYEDVQLKWYTDQERTSSITSFTAGATSKTVYAAADNGTCESAELTAYTYNIYRVPTITVSPRTQSAMCYELVTVTANVTNRTDGALVYWYEGNTEVGTGDQYTFTKESPTTVSNLKAVIRNSQNCNPAEATIPAITFTKHEDCPPSYKQGKIAYMTIGDNTFGKGVSGAWYAAYFYSSSKNTWVRMTDGDNDGVYACEIPVGYTHVIFCYMKPGTSEMKWDNKNNQTAGDNKLSIPSVAKKIIVTNNGDHKIENLESGKTFKTIVLDANGIWNKDNATIYAHPWSMSNQNTGGWSRMIPGINNGEYLVDVYTEYDKIVFRRRNQNGEEYDLYNKHQTVDLDLDIYGNEYVITEAYHGGDDTKANGEWHWKWYNSTYELGVATDVVEQNGDNLQIHCSAVVYKTSCAPGFKHGFEYSTSSNMSNPIYVEYAQGYVEVGKGYEKWIDVEPGEYYVRARVQFEENTPVYGWTKKVVIANNCDPEYEFTVGGTSHVVQACGGNRVLPVVEILTDKTPEGKKIIWGYEWTNEDGSAATNLSATNIASPTFNGTASQVYKLRVFKKLGNDIKCTQSTTYEVAYEDNSPKAAITAKQEVQVNDALVLQGTINNSEGFTWLVKEGDTDVTDRMLSDVNALNPTFNTQETGEYTVSLTAAASQSCEAHTVTTTITVLPPTEDCSSSDIEVKLEGTHNCFNTTGGYLLYKKVGDSWEYITKISSGSSYTFNTEHIDLPLQIFFGAQDGNHCDTSTERKGYTEIQTLTTEDLGLLVTYTMTGDNRVSTPGITSKDGKLYTREFTVTKKSAPVGTSVSAPSVKSAAATVDGTSTTAMLSAYLESTGCSKITSYGFQYIQQDEKPSSSTGAETIQLRTAITIGKTFRTQITSLTEGVYWYRAYATNAAGKSGYTEWKSFTIITDGPYPTLDCNNNAIEILQTGYVKVTVKNIGNEAVLKGSYGLVITDKAAVLAYSPQQVPEIAANNGTVAFTTVLPINLSNYNITATLTYKGRTQTCNKKICVPQVGGTADTIRYTIDASAVTDKCMLVFPSVYEAIDHLKKSNTGDDRFVDIVGEGYILRQPVVMEVVYSTTPYRGNIRVTTTGGYESGEGHLIIPITNINNDGNDGNGTHKITPDGNIVDGYNPLIIRAANSNAMPALQHVAIRKSRSVTLRNLNIISSSVDKDNAIDIDNNNNSWVGNSIGKFKNAKVTISNCKIKSTGFTCVHVSAVDKVYFDNNEITADLVNEDVKNTNTRCWGSSVKFIRSTNIKFIRNNFMGTHATSVWLQGVEKALFMNNVLWNNNKIEEDIFAMFRIVQQSSPEKPKNIGIYYNTLYLADNSKNRTNHPKFNFLTLNSNDASDKDDAIAHDGDFEITSIEFMYNNCYSYDMQTPGRPDVPFKYVNGTPRSAWAGLCYNNFWSAKSGADFSFNGCSTAAYSENVKYNVCTTTAHDPNSLVISGTDLNHGAKPNVDKNGNVGTSGIALNNDDELYQDRTRDGVRPNENTGWTLGAYQQTTSIPTNAIIWQGAVNSDWDNRNNWIDADTRNTLTCVNTLSENLTVIIPAPHSENYPAPDERGIVNYPVLPAFDTRDAKFGSEIVNAGQGVTGKTPIQFAKTINMEYGASLRGVENLGTTRYDEATTEFTAGRDQWILVGTVVKPWDKDEQGNIKTENGRNKTRNVKSGDYFIENHTPHVYMHAAYMDGNTAKWNEPFTSKEEYIDSKDVMAINIPNQYGTGKLTSQAYYTYIKKDPTKVNDHLNDKNYSFTGRFVNESALPKYDGLTAGVPVLLNNSYPANIDPKKIEEDGQGKVVMYDYTAGAFILTTDDDVYIKPQHGFVFTPSGTSLEIKSGMLANGETTSRSSSVEMPIFSLNLFNANSINGEHSRVVVKLDELKDEGPAPLDITKIFADNNTTPEMYIVMYDDMYQRIHISNIETMIPLGIRLKQSMNVSFQKHKVEGFDKVILVDKVKGVEYDLLNTKEVITEELSAGDIEGRFFLNLSESEEDDTEEGDDNVSTEVEEDYTTKAINILVESDNSIKVVTSGVELETIYVSDMAGRTTRYEVSGCSANLELPVAEGVYMVHVVGDTASRTEKVILK